MESKNKVFSYLGFAIKSGNLKIGINAIYTLKTRVYLLILCKSGAVNAVREGEKLKNSFGCPMLITKTFTLEELTGRENCKLAAITDENLASAIIANSEQDFTEYSGGHKV